MPNGGATSGGGNSTSASSNKDVKYSLTGDSSQLQNALDRVTKMMNRLDQVATKLQSRFKKTTTETNKTTTATKKLGTQAKNTSSKLKKMETKLKDSASAANLLKGAFRGIASVISSISLSKLLADAVENSVAYVETLNLFNVALGDLTTKATKFTNVMAEQLGLDPETIMRAVGTYQNLAQSMGMAAETAYLMATNFAKLGVDLSSLWNTTSEQSLQALESGMVGLSKPIRAYGVDITIAALRQEALALGINKSIDSLSRANKLGLIYITVMNRATSSMGDFARTIESPANQLRILQEQFKILSRAIGDFFLGTISKVLPYLNGIVMALSAILRTFATLMGIKIGDFGASVGGVSDAVGDIGDSATESAKAMKNLVAPFDELNILSEDLSSGSGAGGGISMEMDPAILNAMKEYDNLMEKIQMKANKIRDYIMETLGFTKQINKETGEITWTWNFNDMITGMQNAWNDLINWFEGLSPGGKIAAIVVTSFLGYWAGKGATKIFSVLFRPFLLLASKISGIVGTITNAFKLLSTSPAIKDIAGTFSKLAGALGAPVALIVAMVAVAVAAFVTLWQESETFRNNVSESLGELIGRIGGWISRFVEFGASLWQTFSQLIGFLVDVFQPIFAAVWDYLQAMVGGNVEGMLDWLNGFTEFLEGVFTGDISLVVEGIKKMFGGLAQMIVSTFVGAVNLVIKALNWLVDKINSIKFTVPNWSIFGNMAGKQIGFNLGHFEEWTAPDMSEILGYARGGFPSRGDLFRAGENGRYEMVGSHRGKTAVMPLENSDFTSAMQAAVRQGVTQALSYESSLSDGEPIQVIVRIGDKDFDNVVYKSYNRAQRARGARIYGGALNDAT